MPDEPPSPDLCPWSSPVPCLPEADPSLPPRKRLLAGLKQNGWLSSWRTSNQPPYAALIMEEVSLEVDLEGAKMVVKEPERGRECLGESGEETIVQLGSNGDANIDSDKSENGSQRQKSSSPVANSVKKMAIESRNRAESKRQKKPKNRKAVVLSSIASSEAPQSKTESGSHREMAAAAKLTAVMAAKTAAEAKAIAADKAAAAAKAAAVAKAALEAVAIAASDEAWKPRRNSIRKHPKLSIFGEGQKGTKHKVHMPPPVDDEELARQLHRAMNSSPRITRNRTPLHRPKEDASSLSSSQRQLQGNLLQGRRRSSSLKDVEKQELQISRQSFDSSQSHCIEVDVKLNSMAIVPDTAPADSSIQGNHYSDDIISDSAVSEGHADNDLHDKRGDQGHSSQKKSKKSRELYIPNYHSGGSVRNSTPASKNESVYSNNQVCFNVNSEDWSGKANGLDIERSVNQCASLVREGKAVGIKNGNKKRARETSPIGCANEMQDVQSGRDNEDAEKRSSVSIEEQIAISSSASQGEKRKGAQNEVIERKQVDPHKCDLFSVQNSEVEETKLKDDPDAIIRAEMKEFLSEREVKESSSVYDVSIRISSHSRSKPMSKKVLQSTHGHGEEHEEILKGLPKGLSAGKQIFGDGMSLTAYRSAPPVSLRTPTVANGPTGRRA